MSCSFPTAHFPFTVFLTQDYFCFIRLDLTPEHGGVLFFNILYRSFLALWSTKTDKNKVKSKYMGIESKIASQILSRGGWLQVSSLCEKITRASSFGFGPVPRIFPFNNACIPIVTSMTHTDSHTAVSGKITCTVSCIYSMWREKVNAHASRHGNVWICAVDYVKVCQRWTTQIRFQKRILYFG